MEHDLLNLKDMSNFVELLSTLMGLPVHNHMVCSLLHVMKRYELLVEGLEGIVKQKKVFESGTQKKTSIEMC